MPESFEGFEEAIKQKYQDLVQDGTIEPQADVLAPSVPMDLETAKKTGKVRCSSALTAVCCHELQRSSA